VVVLNLFTCTLRLGCELSICSYMCFIQQAEVSSSAETVAKDVQFPVDSAGRHMKPVVVCEKLDFTR